MNVYDKMRQPEKKRVPGPGGSCFLGIGQPLSFESLLPEWSLISEAESEAAKALVGGVADKEVGLRGQEVSQDLFHGVPLHDCTSSGKAKELCCDVHGLVGAKGRRGACFGLQGYGGFVFGGGGKKSGCGIRHEQSGGSDPQFSLGHCGLEDFAINQSSCLDVAALLFSCGRKKRIKRGLCESTRKNTMLMGGASVAESV